MDDIWQLGLMAIPIAFAGPVFLLGLTNNLIDWKYRNSNLSLEELPEVIREECAQLNLDHSKIELISSDRVEDCEAGFAGKKIKGGYVIGLPIEGGKGCNRATVRHELAHIANGDCDISGLRKIPLVQKAHYYLVAEPRAILYSISGKKSEPRSGGDLD
jgi:hypothetical protein